MDNEKKIQLYSCIKRQFADPGLYKSSRVYDWLFTNGFSLEKLGYGTFEELCSDFTEVFEFQNDKNSGFILINDWQDGNRDLSEEYLHPADNFFGTKNIILNDDIIEMTQQSLYALTKILGNNYTVQQMKQEIFRKFEEAKQLDSLDFSGEKYCFHIGVCPDGQSVNGLITKNMNVYGKSLYFSFEKTRVPRSVGLNEKRTTALEIPEDEKKHIYSLLTANFPLNQPLHMATISKFLTERGINRAKYGYNKMKDFLSNLNYLEMQEIILGGVPQILVTIKELYPEKIFSQSSVRYSPYPAYNRNISEHSVGELSEKYSEADISKENIPYGKYPVSNFPKGILTDFCNLPVKPMSILEKFIEGRGEEIGFYELADQITADFENARKNGTIRFYVGKMIFPCRYKKNDGSYVELTLKPSTYEGKEWFLYYVDTAVRENRNSAAYSIRQQESFSFTGDWANISDELKAIAVEEEWSVGKNKNFVLNNYLKFTFERIMREKKLYISADREIAAFNTGLADKHYDDIFACFVPCKNSVNEWEAVGFCTAFSSIAGKNLSEIFNPLPRRAVYFTKKDEMFFDFGRYLHIDHERLLLDNIRSIPLDFLYEQFFDNTEGRDIIEKLRSEYSEPLYNRIKEIIISNSRLSSRLQNCLKNSVELAKKRIKWNYKTAIPAYYPGHDALSLLLPLALSDETVPDAAVLLEITRLGSYQAQAILNLKDAYVYARIIGRSSDDWLSSGQINEDDIRE